VSSQLAWYVARASGILAWLLLSASVIWGLLLSTRLLDRRPSPRWLLDLHRFLGGLAVTFVGVHIAGLVADNYLHFGTADVLLPFASHWRTGAVALGVVGLWLLLAIEITSLLMRHVPRRYWHRVHLASYGLFGLTTLHAVLAGNDTNNPFFRSAMYGTIVGVVFLTVVRVMQPHKPARRVSAGRRADQLPSVEGEASTTRHLFHGQ
jgi:sulfoxide reductase heme-binding subunit YedZ